MNQSYTTVKNADVLKAFERFEKHREVLIERNKDEAFQKLSKRLFFKPKNRDEAVRIMENRLCFYGWDEVTPYVEVVMYDLKNLAQLPNDGFVRVSAEDAGILKKYFEGVSDGRN